jgi:HEAT repeat protein
MKTNFPNRAFLAALLTLAALTARADDQQDQFAILRSNAGVPQKWAACQRLRVIGTAEAVPAVAALLTDPLLSQAARQTLEGLPYPEVDDVLHGALGKTTGVLKAGIIESLGWRAKPAAVPLLLPLLSDPDSTVAAAAATALGRIGGPKAVTALSAARDQPPATVQAAVQASLLECAQRLSQGGDKAGAAAIYRALYQPQSPLGTRTAAWRGLVLTDSAHRAELMDQALGGTDRPVQLVALALLRQSNDPRLLEACAAHWKLLPAESQLAVLDAEVKQGNGALPFVRTASASPNLALRVTAWTAMGQLNDLSSILPLAHAAAAGETAEREAARDSLTRLRGPGASEALLGDVERAAAPEKVELLRALGARGDTNAANVLVQNAAAGEEPVRLAALESLKELAPPQALAPLLDIAEKANSDPVTEQALDALSAVCRTCPDKDAATQTVLRAREHFAPAQQASFLALLADLATPDALAAAQALSKSENLDQAKAGVRVLSNWPNATPAPGLLELARTAADPGLRVLALRGAITLSAAEPAAPRRLVLLKQALAEANRSDEQALALSQVGQIPTPEALGTALKALDNPNVSTEASLAVLNIAEKLEPSNPALAEEVAAKLLQSHPQGEIFQRAWALRREQIGHVPFIRDWVVCGPYARTGVTGAKAIFNISFGPEIPGQTVEWKPAPSGNQVNLAALFAGAENCAAYLRTSVTAPEDCSGVLLLGSDDGVKAWLNGVVVHSHNVDRGEKADQDAAPIHLKRGANDLMLKISQGAGGWGACARIVGADLRPISGLRVERPRLTLGRHESGPG